MSTQPQFDAIVVGSGLTGGLAAKELAERGLKVLMLERGRNVEHNRRGYPNELKKPWDLPLRGEVGARLQEERYPVQGHSGHMKEWDREFYVDDIDHPYQSVQEPGFRWIRGYQLGGRSLTWGRQSYRWSDTDFSANARDGHGCDWPIRYADLAPWYDRVEEFAGVSGAMEGLAQLPDGRFQAAMPLNVVEQHVRDRIAERFPGRCLTIGRVTNLMEDQPELGRKKCRYRSACSRGCSFGATFTTQSASLPAARATGNLTLMTDSLAESVTYDAEGGRADGVNVRDTKTGERSHYTAKVVFLCAGSFNTVALMLRSASEAFPNGIANSSGALGQYIMDHAHTMGVVATMPGFEAHTYYGNRPTGIVVARFRNLDNAGGEFLRGYSYQGGAYRAGWSRGLRQAGLGADFKNSLRGPGEWKFVLTTFGECLPRKENRITLDPVKTDVDGFPQLRIDFNYGENERKLLADAKREAAAMVEAAGGKVLFGSDQPNPGGSAIHEMGGARMGRDRKDSVLNGYCQAHDVPNLFVTDGAAMSSSACQNPSLTYMALTARAAHAAADMLQGGVI